MVKESRILLWVEHLEKCTRRIAVVSATDLVNLVDEDKGVLSTDALQSLDDLSGERSKRGSNQSCSYEVNHAITYPT